MIRAHLTLVHVLHAYASADTPWAAQALSHYTPIKYGRIASVSVAHDATSFGDSICPVCASTFKCLFIQTQLTWALIDTGGGYHLEALNIRSDHSPSFLSSILNFPLIGPPGLQLCQPFDHFTEPHRPSIDYKGPYHEQIPTTHVLPIAYTTKHSTLSLCFFRRGKQSGLVRVFLVQLGFHQTPILKCKIIA
jgi:hypothetical protein